MKIKLRISLLIIFTLSLFLASANAQPRMKRICVAKSGNNTVYWFNFKNPCQAFLQTYIYARENSSNPFKFIDSVPSNQLTYDHNSPAFQRGSYFIVYRALCNGVVTEFISDTLLVDVEPPAEIDPDSVSVGADGEIMVGWKQSSAEDAMSYVIYRMEGTDKKLIDTVLGRSNTIYYDFDEGNPTVNVEKYSIAPIDSCGNIAPIGKFHETMFLSVRQDYCKKEVTLSWTKYIGWNAELLRYDIYASDQKYLGYRKIASVDASTNTAKLQGLVNHKDYYFLVRAVRNSKEPITSSSNRVLLKTNFDDQLEYVYLSNVTFITDPFNFTAENKIRIEWKVSDSTNMSYFEVMRGKAPGVNKLLATIQANGMANYFYEDADMDKPEVWYYHIKAYSKCGNFAGQSNVSNSIVATLQRKTDHRIISWNAYEKWDAGVGSYSVNRQYISNNKAETQSILLSPLDFEYADFDSIVSESSPGVCYFISADENSGNAYGFKSTSRSNVVCYTEEPVVNIPNAFSPDGIYNTIFKPIFLNVDTNLSTMTIVNRWGQIVVRDGSIVRGWNGKSSDGRKHPEGVYAYLITVHGTDGSIKVYKGTVTLL